jgi:UDP-N-acetyl-D-mannosaminuronate dehydrogenase
VVIVTDHRAFDYKAIVKQAKLIIDTVTPQKTSRRPIEDRQTMTRQRLAIG